MYGTHKLLPRLRTCGRIALCSLLLALNTHAGWQTFSIHNQSPTLTATTNFTYAIVDENGFTTGSYNGTLQPNQTYVLPNGHYTSARWGWFGIDPNMGANWNYVSGQVNKDANGDILYTLQIGPNDPTRSRTECIRNNSNLGGWAYWKVNGVIKNKTYLPPGGLACYTMTWTTSDVDLRWGCDWIEPMDPPPLINSDTPFWTTNSVEGGNYAGVSGGTGVAGTSGGTPHTTPMTVTNTIVNNVSNYVSGPIQFSGTGDGAKESTLQAFANATLQQQKEQEVRQAERDKAMLDALKGMSNNTSVVVTNSGGMTTNELAGLSDSVANGQSNIVGGWIAGHSGEITSKTQALGQAWGSPSAGPSAPAASAWELTFSTGRTQATVSSNHPVWQRAANMTIILLSWLAACSLFWQNLKHTEKWVQHVGLSPQATTAGQAAIGTNINAASAFIMGIAIVSLLAALPAFFAAFLTTLAVSGFGESSILSIPVAGESGAWGVAANFIPFGTIIACVGLHLLYRMMINVAGTAIMGAIRLLSGL